jgi:hypothetical protein
MRASVRLVRRMLQKHLREALRIATNRASASVPIPKFAPLSAPGEFRTRKDTGLFKVLVSF